MASEEQEWIEAPEGWGPNEESHRGDPDDGDGGNTLMDLFGKDDPHDEFNHELKLPGGTGKNINLRGFKLDTDEVDRSTGVTIWAAAPRLTNYLQDNPDLCNGKMVLELGAGLGLCGIAAYYLGANMMMTDGDSHALQRMRVNVRENCGDSDAISKSCYGTLDCRQLLWGSPHMEGFSESDEKFDVIIGADIIYTEASIEPLFDTVAYFMKKTSGQFVLSRYNKWNGVDDAIVIEAGNARGMGCTRPSEGIFVFQWT